MSEKILSQAGISLADIYDTEGSIVGVERLETQDVPVMHEMGGTIFSERLQARIIRLPSGPFAQNFTFVTEFAFNDLMPRRVLQINCFVATAEAARLQSLTIFASSVTLINGVSREIPIWSFDNNNGTESTMVLSDAGNAPEVVAMMWPDNNTGIATYLPVTLVDIPNENTAIDRLVMRGTTSGFGAGTVIPTMLALVLAADRDVGSGVSSRGLPLPSW